MLFTSSDETVATVDANGVVTPLSAGTTTITITSAADGSKTDDCVVTVRNIETIPSEYESLYPHTYHQGETSESKVEIAPTVVTSGSTKQLIGNSQGWGDAHVNFVDLSDYEKIIVRLGFSSIDEGKKVGFRFSYATSESAATNTPIVVTVPETLDYTFEIDLSNYSFTNSSSEEKSYIGGFIFYATTHGALSINAAELVTQAVVIDYVAVKQKTSTGTRQIETIDQQPVNVWSISGAKIRENVLPSEATKGLKKGMYIVGNKKVFVIE